MMRIGVDVRELERDKATGIGKYLLNFLKFATDQKPEWEFVLFGNQDTQIDLDVPNIKKIFISECVTFFWDQMQLPCRLKKEKVDLFLAPYFKVPLFFCGKLVLIINDLILLLAPEYQNLSNTLKRVYFKSLLKMAIRKADRIITISHHSKKDIIKLFRVPEKKIKVITLAISEKFRPIDFGIEKIISKYKIDGRFIFYVGNFNPHKNVSILIEAYQKLPVKIKEEYSLVIGGKKDKYYYALFRLVQRLELEDKVIFTDFIAEEDLPYLYNAADIFVFPSLYEGFGLPPLEAMACGTPVIASNTTSLPEVVGVAGILVNPHRVDEIKAAIIKVLTDSALRNDLIKRGLERSMRFTAKKTADQILEVFAEVQGAK